MGWDGMGGEGGENISRSEACTMSTRQYSTIYRLKHVQRSDMTSSACIIIMASQVSPDIFPFACCLMKASIF